LSKGIITTIIGGVEIAAGAVLFITTPGMQGVGIGLMVSGAGMVLAGVGTMLSQGPHSGTETTVRNPIAPWNIRYGQGRVGGTMIFCNSFGDNDKYLDIVVVLAAHACKNVDSLLLNQQRVTLRTPIPTPHGWRSNTYGSDIAGDYNQGYDIVSTNDITRTDNILKIHLSGKPPSAFSSLQVGDQVVITGVHPVNSLVNGVWPIYTIDRSNGIDMTFISGGPSIPGTITIVNSGNIKTNFPDYRSKVYMEVMLGSQNLGDTFQGMTNGTPYDGNDFNLIQNSMNPWNANCSAPGKTLVFLRLHYNDEVFSQGLPQFSFVLSGKNDIYDPRPATPIHAYSTNPVLCMADYMTNKLYGYKLDYTTDLPIPALITAANICDESVSLALGGTESRYTCNGGFLLSARRSEILQNLLTSMAGRLTYIGGQFFLHPGSWAGISASITGTQIYSHSTSPILFRPKVPINQLYNGVKGTFIAQVNNWQSADFPPYAQDQIHGYNNGAPQYLYDQNLTNDQGDRRYLDVQLPFTISCATAQRIAKIELLRRRNQGTGTFSLNTSGYLIAPLDLLAVDLPYFAWTGKYLEAMACRLRIEPRGEPSPAIWTEIDIQEADPSTYSWSIGEELSPQGYQQAIVPDMFTPAPPTNFRARSANGNIYLKWDSPTDAFVLHGGHLEIEYQLVQSPEGLWLSLGRIDPTITVAEIDNLPVGAAYNVQIRSVNVGGVPSAWIPANTDGSPGTGLPITIEPPGIWDPGYEVPIDGDPLFTMAGFGLYQNYVSSAGPQVQPVLGIFGKPVQDQSPPTDSPLSLIFKIRQELVAGPFGQELATDSTSVDGTTDPTFGTAGHGILAFGVNPDRPPLIVDQFKGRIISKIANLQGSSEKLPIQDFIIVSNDAAGNFTVTPDPSALSNPPKAGDLFVARI
jgi:hypothetical protein